MNINDVKGSFFLTGNFYRNKKFQHQIGKLNKSGHYFGPHSDKHLLYCDWSIRDSLLVSKKSFTEDIRLNMDEMKRLNIPVSTPRYFIPPYEWWNDSIAAWSLEMGFQVISFTPGIQTNADYTYPEMGSKYKSSDRIMYSLKDLHLKNVNGLNGAIILIHAGVDNRRPDKLYNRLGEIIRYLKSEGYVFSRVDELIDR